MSVFPKRVVAGEQVIVHVRAKAQRICRPKMRVLLERPCGATVLMNEFHPLIFPIPRAPVGASEDDAVGMRRVSPVYLLARQLVGKDGDLDSMQASIRKMQTSSHFQFAWRIGSDWAPGKYRVHIEMRCDGVVLSSDTLSEAYF